MMEERFFVWLARFCDYNEETMVNDLMTALRYDSWNPEKFRAMDDYVESDYTRFTEYQMRIFWECARGCGKDDAQVLAWVNIWRLAHGYDVFGSMSDVEKYFKADYTKLLYVAGKFNDYNGGDTPVEPQDVQRFVLTDDHTVNIKTAKYNRIEYVIRDYDTLYEGHDGMPEYTVIVECEDEEHYPYFHFVYYETYYDQDEALDRLSPTGKALYYAFNSFVESLNAPLVKGMKTILSDGNFGTLHRSVSAMQMALNRLETALRENGVY